MITRIRKWGNSLGLRIPKHLADDADVTEGTSVDLQVKNGSLVVTPVQEVGYVLEDLLANVKPSNLHEEVDIGRPAGREAW